MNRTENIKKNLTFSIIKYVAQILLQFVLRTVLIYFLGAEYLGLGNLFTNIFTFLNLAELGIGSAIVFAMYKPIAENDIEKIKSLQNLYKKFYLTISAIVLVVGLIITPFLKFLIKGGVSVDINIYVLYLMYLANTLVGYFSAHKRSLLFAYQRNDVENLIKTLCLIAMTIIQIIAIVLFKNFYIYFSITIVFTVIECFLIHLKANKLYPEINGKAPKIDSETKKQITHNMTALSFNKIGAAVVNSTDNILISTFFGAVLLGVYSNYYLIIYTAISIFALLNSAITASVGNLIASENKEYVYEKFKQLNFYYSLLTCFCTVCLTVLLQPFMLVWTGGGIYMLEFSSVIFLSLGFYLARMRQIVCIFKEGAGLFWEDRWKPIVEALVNLLVSILLAKLIGINGIFIGTIISTLAAPLWVEPMVLYKHYFNKSVKSYFIKYITNFFVMLIITFICFIACYFIPSTGLLWLVVKFAVCIALSLSLIALTYCKTKEFKELITLIKNFCKKVFRKSK